jgi:hypothetical protein
MRSASGRKLGSFIACNSYVAKAPAGRSTITDTNSMTHYSYSAAEYSRFYTNVQRVFLANLKKEGETEEGKVVATAASHGFSETAQPKRGTKEDKQARPAMATNSQTRTCAVARPTTSPHHFKLRRFSTILNSFRPDNREVD